MSAIVRESGAWEIAWDIDTRDWARPGPAQIRVRAQEAQAGSIVLMHDAGGDRQQSVAALPGIIADLRGRGFELVGLPC